MLLLKSTSKRKFNFYGRHTDLVGQYKENICEVFADSISKDDTYFCEFVKAELIKLAKMAGAMHEADRAYSVRSIW